MTSNELKWDSRFMDVAKLVSTWSKDPSTQVGSVIVFQRRIIATGYNGFPSDIEDKPEWLNDRYTKLDLMIHAEDNAIRNCIDTEELFQATVYVWPFMPCSNCAKLLAEYGISRVVSTEPPADKLERWATDFNRSKEIFDKNNIEFVQLTYNNGVYEYG